MDKGVGNCLAAAIIALALMSCGGSKGPDQWDAFVYPDRDSLITFEAYRGFKTFELCQTAAITRLRAMPDPDAGDYECGHRCQPPMYPDGPSLCAETKK